MSVVGREDNLTCGIDSVDAGLAKVDHAPYEHIVRHGHNHIVDVIDIPIESEGGLREEFPGTQCIGAPNVKLIGGLRKNIRAAVMVEIGFVESGHTEYILI